MWSGVDAGQDRSRGFRSRVLEEILGAISYHPPQLAMCGIQACLPSHEVWMQGLTLLVTLSVLLWVLMSSAQWPGVILIDTAQ